MECHIEQTLARIEHFERSIPWMYLDARGRVTVGVGMVLTDVTAATRLPFQVGARAANEDEIASDFARVDTLAKGRPALFYRRPGGPELESPVIDTLLRTALVGLEEHLREHIEGYNHLPSPAKMALLEMAHSLTPPPCWDNTRDLSRLSKQGSGREPRPPAFATAQEPPATNRRQLSSTHPVQPGRSPTAKAR